MSQYCMTYGNYENEYGREYVYPSERMYVHASVYLPNSEIDPRTGMLKPDSPRRGRTQAKRMEYAYLDKEYKQLDAALKARQEQPGIRISMRAAVLVLAVTAFFLGLLLLTQQGTLAERQKYLNRMNKAIEECAQINDELASQIASASDSTTICYAAARDLNMIPGEAAEAIHLVALDTRPLETQASAAKQNTQAQNNASDEAPGTMGDASSMNAAALMQTQTQGQQQTGNTQETPVPMIASAGAH